MPQPVMKQQQPSKRRRHVGLPIPSFTAASSEEETSMMMTFTVEILIATEAAIRTFLVPRKRNYLNVRKEWNAVANGVLANHQSTTNPSNQKNYSKQSLLLMDLLTVASPTLYTLEDDVLTMITTTTNGAEYSSRISELRRLASGNPMVSVKKRKDIEQQVLKVLGKKEAVSDSTLLTSTVQKTKKLSLDEILQGGSSVTVKHENNQTPSTATTTLVERVAARAKAKQDWQQEHERQSKSGSLDYSNPMLLRVADALWSHSRHVMLRQARLAATTKQNNQPSCMVMTVKDVCSMLMQCSKKDIVAALLELQSRAPTWIVCSTRPITKQTSVWIHAIQDYQALRATLSGSATRVTKQQSTGEETSSDTPMEESPTAETTTTAAAPTVRSAVTTNQLALKRKDPDNNSSGNKTMLPEATTSKLALKSKDSNRNGNNKTALPATATTSKVALKRKDSNNNADNKTDLPARATTSKLVLKRKDSNNDSKGLDAILGKVQKTAATLLKPTTLKFDSAVGNADSSNGGSSSNAPLTRKRKPRNNSGKPLDNTSTTVSSNNSLSADASRKDSPTTRTSTRKRKVVVASTESPSPPPRKKKRTNILRINHNLIHTDADYDGGEVLEIDQISSPRGLKRLFLQMNAGHRI